MMDTVHLSNIKTYKLILFIEAVKTSIPKTLWSTLIEEVDLKVILLIK